MTGEESEMARGEKCEGVKSAKGESVGKIVILPTGFAGMTSHALVFLMGWEVIKHAGLVRLLEKSFSTLTTKCVRA